MSGVAPKAGSSVNGERPRDTGRARQRRVLSAADRVIGRVIGTDPLGEDGLSAAGFHGAGDRRGSFQPFQIIQRRRRRQALAVLVIGLMVSVAGSTLGVHWSQWEDQVAFAALVERTRERIERRLIIYTEALHGVRLFFENSNAVTLPEFQAYVEGLSLQERYPGVQAIEFARRVAAADLSAYERRVRTEGAGHAVYEAFAVRSDPAHSGAPIAEHHVVEYAEPLAANAPAVGFDLASSPIRLEAIQRARETDRVAASGAYPLLVDSLGQPGIRLSVPVRGQPAATGNTAAAHPTGMDGSLSTIIRIADLMAGLGIPQMHDVLVRVVDQGLQEAEGGPTAELFASPGYSAASPLRTDVAIAVGDRRWLLSMVPPPGYRQHDLWSRLPSVILVGGGLMTLLSFWAVWSLGRLEHIGAGLRASRAYTSEVLAAAVEGFCRIEWGTWRIVDVNGSLCRLLEQQPADLLGQSLADVLDSGEDVRTIFAGDGGEPPRPAAARTVEVRLRGGSGRIATTLFSPVVVRADDGRPVAAFAFVTDITERKAADVRTQALIAELAASNRELEQFAYVASHDLREPLRMVNGFVDLIERQYADRLDDEGHEFLGYIRDGARRMDRLIIDLLHYARVGRNPDRPGPVAATEAIETACRNLQATITEAGAQVLRPEHIPEVVVNDGELVRLFQNVIGNAIKYRHPARPPVVAIACRPGPDRMQEFVVRDNGIGIPEEHAERIFGIFQRLHARDEYDGTGIGLAICRKIVERHGGRMWVESNPDGGSDFHFTLPAVL